jgi:hypothetical protein
MNKVISDHMRAMQRRSADARWSGLSIAERRAKMSALAKARWAKRPKTKSALRRSKEKAHLPPTDSDGGAQKGQSK